MKVLPTLAYGTMTLVFGAGAFLLFMASLAFFTGQIESGVLRGVNGAVLFVIGFGILLFARLIWGWPPAEVMQE